MNENIKIIIQDYESAVCKILLYCIEELPFPLGIKKTISVLKGSKSTFIINYELHNLATYSLLPTFTGEQLRTIIETLIKAEFLKVEFVSRYENIPILAITQKGRDFLAGICKENVKFLENFVDRSIPEFDDFEKELFDELRNLRRKIAQGKNIPAFMICGDTTLRELTKQKPTDSTSLLSVRGIGEKFVHNYGNRFIETIKRHINNSRSSSGE